jgi:hypothetical protein
LLRSYVDQLVLGQLHVVLHYDGTHFVPFVNQVICPITVCGQGNLIKYAENLPRKLIHKITSWLT